MSNMEYSKEIPANSNSNEPQKKYMLEFPKSYAFSKRSFDIIISSLGIVITMPLYVVIWLLCQFGENKGPLIFKQKRVGKNGELFYIYKFRSMIVDADKKLKEDRILYQKYIKNNYKLEPEEDPRITKLGQFLRKTSLDEIPQLINVFQGKMSLVGPRPIVEEELKEYGRKTDQFLSVKPGITGYWQISGRSDVGYPERVNLELYYVYNKSFILDLKIFIVTIWQVLIRKGAY